MYYDDFDPINHYIFCRHDDSNPYHHSYYNHIRPQIFGSHHSPYHQKPNRRNLSYHNPNCSAFCLGLAIFRMFFRRKK